MKAMTKKIAGFICKDMCPIGMVSGEGFQDNNRTGATIKKFQVTHSELDLISISQIRSMSSKSF